MSGGVCECECVSVSVSVCVRAGRDRSVRAHQFGDEWREEQQFDFSLLSQHWLMEWHPLFSFLAEMWHECLHCGLLRMGECLALS